MRRIVVVISLMLAVSWGIPAFAATFSASDEVRMAQMVNAARTQGGLAPLKVTSALTELAHQQATKIYEEQKLSHNLQIGIDLRALGVATSWTGENAVVAPDIDVAQQAFLGSPHHLENIIRPSYNALGVGVVPEPKDGVVWVVQVFAEVKGLTSSVAPAPAPVVRTAAPPTPRAVATTTAPAAPKPTWTISSFTPKQPRTVAIGDGSVTDQPRTSSSHVADKAVASGLFALTLTLTARRRRPTRKPTGVEISE